MTMSIWSRRAILLVIVLCLTFANVAHAQMPAGRLHLTTSPLPISLKARPGETVETELRVRNSSSGTEKLKVGLMKFSAFGEEGKPKLEDRGADDDYFDWVTFSKTEFEAPANEWQSIMMKIALPNTAAFGYYYAVTFSRVEDETASEDLETAVRGGSATLVLLEADVPGAKREAKIEEFKIDKRSYEFLPARFSTKVKNTGNVHTAPRGTIFISRGGKQVATIDVNATKGNILPGSSRIFNAEWGDGFPAYRLNIEGDKVVLKDGQPTYSLSWDFSQLKHLRFGKYSATLVMAYDDGTRDIPMEASLSFWVIPWRLILLIIAIPLVPSVAVYLLMKRRMRGRRYEHK